MANTILTPGAVADQAIIALYEQLAMMPLVHRDTTPLATQKKGNTVNIKKPVTFVANKFDRAVGIVPQNITETQTSLVLNDMPDVSFTLTSEELTLAVEDVDRQYITPATQAIAQYIDLALFKLRDDVTQVVGVSPGILYSIPEVLIDAGVILDINKVPVTDRVAVIGPKVRGLWLNQDVLKHADKSGSTDALRSGSIGRDLFGFETFMSQNVGQPKATGAQVTGDPTTEVGLAFHKSAFAFASAPLEVAPGSNAVIRTYDGISIRVAWQYDIKFKQTVFSLDCLFGVKTLSPERAVLIRGPLKA